MESRNPKLHRSDMEMNMPPRWGFSSFDVGAYKDVAPPELKNSSSVAGPTAVLIQQQCTPALSPRGGNSLRRRWDESLNGEGIRGAGKLLPLLGERAGVRASVLSD